MKADRGIGDFHCFFCFSLNCSRSYDFIQLLHCFCHAFHIGDTQIALVVFFLQGTSTHMSRNVVEYLREHLTLIERTVHVTNKLHLHHSLLEHDFLAAQLLSQSTQNDYANQFVTRLRYRSESIDESLTISLHLIVALQMV